MITMLTGQHGSTYHAANRDSTAALCRANLKPRNWADRGSSTGYTAAIYRVPGSSSSRSCSGARVNCLACQRKLAKLTAEAFDAATAYQTGTAQAKNLPPVAVGSIMWYALVQVRDYGNGLHVDNRTLDALVRRGLAEGQDCIRYAYGLTDAGAALVGRKIERPGRGSAPAVPYSVGDAVRQSDGMAATVVEVVADVVTVRAGDGQEYEHAADELEPAAPVALHMRRADSNLVFRVLGTEGRRVDVTVHLISPNAKFGIARTVAQLVEDGWVACDVEGNVQAATVRQSPLEPFPNADHLIGERVTLTSADPRQRAGTLSGVIAHVRPAPHGSAHAVAELASGWLVDLPASLVEATAPRG